MTRAIKRLWQDESGQNLTEYAVLLALLAIAGIAAMRELSNALGSAFSSSASNLASLP
jgi:pilus assembly protein Flp/PilA